MEPLIDTHTHLIYPDRFRYPWLEGVPVLQRPFTLADFAAMTQGHAIESTLFMEVDVTAEDAIAEARYFMDEASAPDVRLAGAIAAMRPESKGFAEHLEQIAGARLKGVRRILHRSPDATSQSALFRQNIRLLGQRGLPFDLCLRPDQCPIGLELVDACPSTFFVLDHCGNPNIREAGAFNQWRQTIKRYAERDHLNVKLSGLVSSGQRGKINLPALTPFLDVVLEAFGAGRCVWGSDWPVCTLGATLPEWITLFREWLAPHSESERAGIARLNARQIYHLES